MDFLEKVNFLMQERNLNRHTLSEACGIPYTTIDGWYKKGYEGAKISTLIKLADYFCVELDYLVRPSITDRNFGRKVESLSSDEENLLSRYRSLNSAGQTLVNAAVKGLCDDPNFQKERRSASAM